MVSKEAGRCALSNSESDSECGGSALGDEGGACGDAVRKRNKALQVRFKDICEAQNEVARLARATRGRSVSCKVVHMRYMTMPARRSIPNVTKSTAVQTSPDLRKRYQTFPFERKKGHTIKHTALVENYQGQNNGFLSDVKGAEEERPCGGNVQKTRVLLHSMPPCSDMQDLCSGLDCPENKLCPSRETNATSDQLDVGKEAGIQGGGSKHKGLTNESEEGAGQGPNCAKVSSSTCSMQPLQDRGGASKVTGPIAWTSLTQVECLESPSVRCKPTTETAQLNGLQSQTQSHAPSCPPRDAPQAHYHGDHGSTDARGGTGARKCGQVIPLPGVEGDVKARLQAMETLINSSQETIKVLLGVIQELEKGEAQREGRLSYRTGQDTANCDTCRNSACIIYSVELDFKLQEDKLQPLMRRLCPTVDLPYTSLPYSQEVFTSTPKRKSKSETKKHARWKLWFL